MKKHIILLFVGILIFGSCSNEELVKEETLENTESFSKTTNSLRTSSDKVSVCHKNANDIAVGAAALATHIAHGDAVDMDGDGFYNKENPCSEVDCDDNTYSLENTCGTPANVGDLRDGGVVFWVNPENNNHGMVVSLIDLGLAEWGCYLTSIPQNNSISGGEFGDGFSLTQNILENCTQTGIAAELAVNYRGGNRTDWFLPSYKELMEIMYNDWRINPTLGANGGQRVAYIPEYWSSNQRDAERASNAFSLSIFQVPAEKFLSLRVRAVRSF